MMHGAAHGDACCWHTALPPAGIAGCVPTLLLTILLTLLLALLPPLAETNETADIFSTLDTEVRAADMREDRHAAAGPGGDEAAAGPSSSAAAAAGGGAGSDGEGGDARILRQLLEGASVRGALDHSKIEAANDPGR
jgi:hypothetical protein